MPTFNAKLALSSRSCSEKAPFVVHKITIDYAFDQVFKPKMLSLHENFAPQILTFMHELPFFPSYFVWNPFCFSRGFLCVYSFFLFVFAVDLFLLWMPLCIFLLPFCFCCEFLCVYFFLLFVFLFSPLFLQFSPTKSEKRGRFIGKSPSFFGKSPSFF